MNAILVTNRFLRGEKFDALHTHLIKSAAKSGINLIQKDNLSLATEKAEADFVLFWDKDVNLARRLEKQGLRVFNSSHSIAVCDDKARTYIELDGIVPQPETLISPLTFFESDMSEFAQKAADILGLPLVFKECFGSFGQQVFLCGSVDEIVSHIGVKPFILQKFVSESAGRDIRLEVVGGKCVCAVRRENKNDFRSNVTNGGTMSAYTPTEEQAALAVSACEALGLTFGGVDLLENGQVCEVNSNAHIINIMQAAGLDIAPLIFEEIKRQCR
jgi:RimK family alpha-L-glutamate ligase